MSVEKEIIVNDWVRNISSNNKYLKLTLSADERKILRGKKYSDCNKALLMQLPRDGIIIDGDILKTNQKDLYIKVLAKKETLIKISASCILDLTKAAYHLGNRHVEIEIDNENIFLKEDSVIENLLINLNLKISKTTKKFFPEIGAFNHDKKQFI